MDHKKEQGYFVRHFTCPTPNLQTKSTHRKYPESSHGIVPTDNETLNINLSQTTDGVSGHFITHSSQSQLTINGIRVPTRTIAGPLPLFAVIEIGDLAAFWWGDSEGLHYLPRRPTTPTKVITSCPLVEEETNMANRALESAQAWDPRMNSTTSTTMTFHWQREQSCLQVSSTPHCSVSLN